jgi:uncharacterized membrane protein YidH (DUF202 family)
LPQTAGSLYCWPPHDIAAGPVPTAIAFILAGIALLAVKTPDKEPDTAATQPSAISKTKINYLYVIHIKYLSNQLGIFLYIRKERQRI